MSEQLHDQTNYYQIPSDNCMSATAASSENPVQADPSYCGNFDFNQRPGNDADFFSCPEDISHLKSGTDSLTYGRPSLSPSYQQDHETDSSHFEELSVMPKGELMLQGSNFHYTDDPFGVVTADDENEEFCAELAERWVEEQIQREDLGHMCAQDSGDCDDLNTYESQGNILCNELFQDNSRYQPISSLKSPVDIPSSRAPITPLHQSASSPKCGEQKRGSSAKKRSASEVSNASSTQKPHAKRRNGKNQAHSQGMCPSMKSPSRLRMDNALNERLQAQLALREALYNLENAQILVQNCRARYSTAKSVVQTIAETECEALLREETPWNNMFHQLKKYKDATGCCNVKQVEDNKSPEMARLAAWIGKNRKGGKLNGKAPGGSAATGRCNLNQQINRTSPTPPAEPASVATVCGDNAESSQSDNYTAQPCKESQVFAAPSSSVSPNEPDDLSVFEDFDPEGILADPYKKIALDSIGFDWDPRTSRWNTMYEELKAFKDAHGTTLVPHANHGLGSWVKRQQVQYNLYTSGSKSELTEERVRLLNDLGFVWSRRLNQWNESFQRLKRYSEEHGTCNVPDGSDDPELVALAKWVADQRVHYKRHVAEDEVSEVDVSDDNTTKKKAKKKLPKLCPEKINALKSIGFEFDSRDAKWLQKLDVLLQYKKNHGDFLVPSNYPEDPTLSNWVASQRQQYKLYKNGRKSHMTERRLKILIDSDFPFSSKEVLQKMKEEATQQDIDEFDAKSWDDKYKDLLFHIAKHGTISLQKNNTLLWDWVVKQREELYRFGSDSDGGDAPDDAERREHVAMMQFADLFAASRVGKTNTGDNSQDHTSAPLNRDESWDSQFGSLCAWYIKYGTYSNKGMPSRLKKFMSKQQEEHKRFHAGALSELTSDRVEKLNDIYFPFDDSREASTDDIAASRRNKSWEEYRLDLAISFIHKGNYDLQAIDDIELRRWAGEQKRQHKLYLSGKQSSLSFTQIQRLIDIKFISKKAKQWSWPELCGDLMAFRIQFGNFDVSGVNTVHTSKAASKGKSSIPGAASSALKNIQDFVTKLRMARDEFTPELLVKLNKVEFPWEESGEKNVIEHQTTKDAVPAAQVVPYKRLTKHIFGMVLEMSA